MNGSIFLVGMAHFAMLVNEVITWKFTAARLARIILHIHVEWTHFSFEHRSFHTGRTRSYIAFVILSTAFAARINGCIDSMCVAVNRQWVDVAFCMLLVTILTFEGVFAVNATVQFIIFATVHDAIAIATVILILIHMQMIAAFVRFIVHNYLLAVFRIGGRGNGMVFGYIACHLHVKRIGHVESIAFIAIRNGRCG